MDFTLSMDATPPDAMISAGGELDIFTTARLSDRLQDAVEIGCRQVLMDLSTVSFVDASALRVLDRFQTQLIEADGALRFVAWSPPFLRLCRMTGLDGRFHLEAESSES